MMMDGRQEHRVILGCNKDNARKMIIVIGSLYLLSRRPRVVDFFGRLVGALVGG